MKRDKTVIFKLNEVEKNRLERVKEDLGLSSYADVMRYLITKQAKLIKGEIK